MVQGPLGMPHCEACAYGGMMPMVACFWDGCCVQQEMRSLPALPAAASAACTALQLPAPLLPAAWPQSAAAATWPPCARSSNPQSDLELYSLAPVSLTWPGLCGGM